MRRRIGASIATLWWQGLGRLGLDRARWQSLPRTTRRAVKALVWIGIGLLLIAFLGVWKPSALVIGAIVFLLVVPDYSRILGRRVGRFVVPVGILAIAVTYPFYASSNGSVTATRIPTTAAARLPWRATAPLTRTEPPNGIEGKQTRIA